MKTKQLNIPIPFAPTLLPPGYYLRTMVDQDLALFADFDIDITYKNEMAWHTLYKPSGIWIGHILRDFADEPWQIAATGQDKVRGVWDDFSEVILSLLRWQDEIEEEMKHWRKMNGI